MQIRGRVALITGASRGIGAAAGAAFLGRGARVALTARSIAASDSPEALAVPADITTPQGRAQVIEATLARFGRIDFLVNNAGMGLYAPTWDAPEADARRLFELNLFAPLELTRLALPHLRASGGAVVNVSSVAGQVPLPWFTLYSASKFALCALSDGLRMELKHSGVHVMTFCPGYVKTEFQDHALVGRPPDRVLSGKKYAITAGQCAEDLVRSLERGARTAFSPGWYRWFTLAARLFPGILEDRFAEVVRNR